MADNDQTTTTEADAVDVTAYLQQGGLEAKLSEASELRSVGVRLIGWLLLVIVACLVVITIIAILTFPSQTDVTSLLDTNQMGSPTRIEAYRQLRQDWFNSIKDLSQLLVVSLFVPLLATIIGHVFTRSSDGAGS